MSTSRSGKLLLAAALVVGCALSMATTTAAATAAVPHAAALSPGPIGWDTYRQLDGMATLRPGAQTKQFSSFDRAGGNDDGFNGTYTCLRTTADGCVIAEKSGAGELEGMWFTRDNGSMVNNGTIKVELDGTTVLDASLQDVVDGRLGAPFVWPLVGNGNDTAGGSVIKVPMPYTRSMRVTVQNNPDFYHVDYREFPDATGVSTFDPGDPAQDVVDRLRAFGIRDPKPAASGAATASTTADIAAGASARFASLTGPGEITQLRVRLPQVVSDPGVTDDGRAFGAGGGSGFTVAVDPANTGVRLTRRVDPFVGNQDVNLLVDGQAAGQWLSGPAAPAGTWQDQSIELPAALTAGKSSLRLSNQFVSADVDANEFRYDAHSKLGDDWVRTDVLDLGPGHNGEEQAHGYAITGETWEGARVFRYVRDAGQVAASDAVLAGTRLKITFDGRATVDAPLGEFFGSGLGKYDSQTMMSSVDATDGGAFTAWWPMPYASSATVDLVDGSGQPITGAVVQVTSAPDAAAASGLQPGGALGYFEATSHSAATANGADWSVLDAQGRGVFYGETQSMTGLTSVNPRAYLEGDERVYVDGAATPVWQGTGTEDFFESGWYFRGGTTYSMPLAGNPDYEVGNDGCQYDCTGAIRLMAGDAVSFSSKLSFGIEHGPADDVAADYSTTAYWYGQPDAGLTESDVLDPADAASRTTHQYTADGETTGTLTSAFEGTQNGVPVAHGVTAATGAVNFTVTLPAGNQGARLLRMGDQSAGYQQAAVFVDGAQVGTWQQPLANTTLRWLEDSFELPAGATAGKSSVAVRIVPVAGSPAWSAARYRVEAKG